jgi:hypothetical protein
VTPSNFNGTVNIPEGITAIGPSTATQIGNNAFANTNPNLLIWLAIGRTHIQADLFKNTGVRRVVIPNGVLHIGNNAFENTNIQSITIPSSVTFIGARAFANTSLSNVIFTPGNWSPGTAIGNQAFANTRLRNVSLPQSVRTLGSRVFCGSDLNTLFLHSHPQMQADSLAGAHNLQRVSFDNCPFLNGLGIAPNEIVRIATSENVVQSYHNMHFSHDIAMLLQDGVFYIDQALNQQLNWDSLILTRNFAVFPEMQTSSYLGFIFIPCAEARAWSVWNGEVYEKVF